MAGGFRLEHFDIKKPAIGKGGFGEVYEAQPKVQCTLPSKVALKKVNKGVSQRRVIDEIEVMKKVGKHNNIVQFYDYFKENGDFYLILELCSHGDLRKYVKERGPLSERGAAEVLKQLICAMTHWSKMEIIHRDLSAGNILITKMPIANGDHDGPFVKVADFGLARALDRNTPAMTYAGTPGYMSNEVMDGSGYNEKADVYSLGGLLYFMLSGEEPKGEDLKGLHSLSQDARDLIHEMRAPQDSRPDFKQIKTYAFMRNTGASVETRKGYRNSRSREASHDRQASGASYPRRLSQGRDRSENASRGNGPAETGNLRRRSAEPRPAARSREPPRRQGSRADSGFQSSGHWPQDNGHRPQQEGGHRPQEATAQRREQPQYRPDSVANGFLKNHLPWPCRTDHLRGKKNRSKFSRTMVDLGGNVAYEMAENEHVKSIVRVQIVGGGQQAYFYQPRYGNCRLPELDDPPVEMDQSVRTTPARCLSELSPTERTIYEKLCYILFNMGFEVERVTLINHRLFPWSHCNLMENGDLRVLPKDRQDFCREKYVRKTASNNGGREVIYRRMPVDQGGRTGWSAVTDADLRRNMDTMYELCIKYEHLDLESGNLFPTRHVFSGTDRLPPQSNFVPRRVPAVEMAASIASAPGRLPHPPSRGSRAPSAPPTARMVDSDLRQVARTTAPSSSASSGQLSYQSHGSRQPLRETQPTTAPQHRNSDFEVKRLLADKPFFSIRQLSTGNYLRMSSSCQPDTYIYRPHISDPRGELRFDYYNKDRCHIPPEAVALADRLKAFLSSNPPL